MHIIYLYMNSLSSYSCCQYILMLFHLNKKFLIAHWGSYTITESANRASDKKIAFLEHNWHH